MKNFRLHIRKVCVSSARDKDDDEKDVSCNLNVEEHYDNLRPENFARERFLTFAFSQWLQ
jgi:hypothetical protein